MFQTLSYAQYAELAENSKRVTVFTEISGDGLTPVRAFYALGEAMHDGVLLESNLEDSDGGRFSYLGFDCQCRISSDAEKTLIENKKSRKEQQGNPISIIRDLQQEYASNCSHGQVGFVGGLVGVVPYEAVRLFSPVPSRHPKRTSFPDLLFKAYRAGVTFDHQSGKVTLFVVTEVGQDGCVSYQQGLDELETIKAQLCQESIHVPSHAIIEKKKSDVMTNLDDAAYAELVVKAKEYIKAGDIFQVVLSREFMRPYTQEPIMLYRTLRNLNPAPYLFYVEDKLGTIIGASPEKLVSANDGRLQTVPLAGTRKRSQERSDESLARELKNDSKECAEHMMLVDLARNDLGRIAKAGTVNVTKLQEILTCSHVLHMASLVEADIAEDKDGFDALESTLPAGTLSGAPKIRAMQIIDELEPSRRGIYGGAICFIDHQGNFNSCIAIRMAYLKDGIAHVQAGAGIVYDSDPASEAQETRAKAQAVLDAIATAEGEQL